jgi:hypothetical protein
MTLEIMKELFGVAHVKDDEQEVPNVKRMRVVEEKVSLSYSVTVAVLPEEEEVLVPQDPPVALEEEEFPAPTVAVPLEEEEVPVAPLSLYRLW